MTNKTARCRDEMGRVQGRVQGAQDHRSVPTLDIEFRSTALAPMTQLAPIKHYTRRGKTAPRNTWLAPARPEPPISHQFMLIGDGPEQHRRPSRLICRCHRRIRESEPSQPTVNPSIFSRQFRAVHKNLSLLGFPWGEGNQFGRPDHNQD